MTKFVKLNQRKALGVEPARLLINIDHIAAVVHTEKDGVILLTSPGVAYYPTGSIEDVERKNKK